MKAKLMQFWNDDAGITALEYGLIAGLVAVALIASVGLFTGSLQSMYRRSRRSSTRPRAPEALGNKPGAPRTVQVPGPRPRTAAVVFAMHGLEGRRPFGRTRCGRIGNRWKVVPCIQGKRCGGCCSHTGIWC